MEKRSQTKVAMAYGAMYGLAASIVSLIFYFAGIDMQSKTPQWTGYVVLIIFIVVGIKSYRDTELSGFISYGKSLGTGTLIGLFGGFITGVYTVILFTVIDPGLAAKIIEKIQEQWAEKGMTEEQISVALMWTKRMMSPVMLFIWSIVGSAFMSFLFSLIISIFMRKEGTPFQTNGQTLDSGAINPQP